MPRATRQGIKVVSHRADTRNLLRLVDKERCSKAKSCPSLLQIGQVMMTVTIGISPYLQLMVCRSNCVGQAVRISVSLTLTELKVCICYVKMLVSPRHYQDYCFLWSDLHLILV